MLCFTCLHIPAIWHNTNQTTTSISLGASLMENDNLKVATVLINTLTQSKSEVLVHFVMSAPTLAISARMLFVSSLRVYITSLLLCFLPRHNIYLVFSIMHMRLNIASSAYVVLKFHLARHMFSSLSSLRSYLCSHFFYFWTHLSFSC